jgi:hypothetical protein
VAFGEEVAAEAELAGKESGGCIEGRVDLGLCDAMANDVEEARLCGCGCGPGASSMSDCDAVGSARSMMRMSRWTSMPSPPKVRSLASSASTDPDACVVMGVSSFVEGQ